LALMAAQANAAALAECGHSYAFQMHGTEPELSNDSRLNYIVAIGQITFGAASTTPGPTLGTCGVTHLDTFYNDNSSPTAGVGTFTGAPAGCYAASSLLGGGIGCFDGADHQFSAGTLTRSTDGNGAATLAIDPSFGWTDGAPGASNLPLAFTLQANLGGAIILGNSVTDPGPAPTSPPPGSPVLVTTLQKQSTTATLPVTGVNPLACGPLGCTGTGASTDNGYGVNPYLGLSISLFEGFGSPSSNPFQTPGITGSFGSTISALQIFANGQAGGSASFSSNDNVGNTTGGNNGDCDTTVTQTGNFADGTNNNDASIINPSANCTDAVGAAKFQLSGVQFGATDTSDYVIVTGLTDTPDLGGALIPAGIMSTALGLSSSPAGTLTTLAVPTAFTVIADGGMSTPGYIKFTNTSPAGCQTSASITGAAGDGHCTISVTATGPSTVAEGDTPSTQYWTTKCSCDGTESAGVTANLVISSANCPISGGTGIPSTVTKPVSCNN